MPKPKQFLKENKRKSKHAVPRPQTAEDYLAAGVDFEEAAEKWRGGDSVKSTRFFIRAINCYDEALRKFPASFDLAYNKARVQYDLTQHPKLLAQLPGTTFELLQTALQSSRYAMSLDSGNADVLFNTAQLLTSLAEAFSETPTPATATDPLPLLEEALDLFQKCISIQELQAQQFFQQQQQVEAALTTIQDDIPKSNDSLDLEDGGASLSPVTDTEARDSSERWATILEPVTNETLLDTLISQLSALTTLLPLLPSPSPTHTLNYITTYSSPVLEKLRLYSTGTGREVEARIARANFTCAFATASFVSGYGETGLEKYCAEMTGAWSQLGAELDINTHGLIDMAEALISFADTLGKYSLAGFAAHSNAIDNQQEASKVLATRWTALTTALSSLSKATKLPAVENSAKIHILRGDVELLRYQLGQGFGYEASKANASLLLKNSETFYRGGKAVATEEGDGDVEREGNVKEQVVACLRGVKKWEGMRKDYGDASDKVLEEMVEDGLVGVKELTDLGVS